MVPVVQTGWDTDSGTGWDTGSGTGSDTDSGTGSDTEFQSFIQDFVYFLDLVWQIFCV